VAQGVICVEAKQNCEESVVIGYLDLKLDHYALGLMVQLKYLGTC